MLNYEPLTAIIDNSPMSVIPRLRLAYARVFNSGTVKLLMHEYGLTQTEAELALLICKGVPTGVIASSLNKSPGTVKVQRQRLYLKTRVSRAEQLVSIVFMNVI